MHIDTLKLRTAMLRRELKQKELAEKANLSYSMMNSICRGRACSSGTADKIAEALEIPLEELIENGGA